MQRGGVLLQVALDRGGPAKGPSADYVSHRNGDDALLTNLLHRPGDEVADLALAVGGNSGHLRMTQQRSCSAACILFSGHDDSEILSSLYAASRVVDTALQCDQSIA